MFWLTNQKGEDKTIIISHQIFQQNIKELYGNILKYILLPIIQLPYLLSKDDCIQYAPEALY